MTATVTATAVAATAVTARARDSDHRADHREREECASHDYDLVAASVPPEDDLDKRCPEPRANSRLLSCCLHGTPSDRSVKTSCRRWRHSPQRSFDPRQPPAIVGLDPHDVVRELGAFALVVLHDEVDALRHDIRPNALIGPGRADHDRSDDLQLGVAVHETL